MTAHATWNASAFFGGGGAFVLTYVFAMVPAFLLLVGFAVWARQPRGPDADPLADRLRRSAA